MLLSFMERLARLMALLGGLVLTVLVILVCVSVLGRGANTFGHWEWLEAAAPGLAASVLATGVGPVPGDFELVEAGIAFAIFAFLPLCQLHAGHATVDVFTSLLPRRVNDWLIAFWEVLLTLVILLITWRLSQGMLDKIGNGETTFILQFPIWWAYAGSFAAALAASVVAVYCAVARVLQLASGRRMMPEGEGAGH
ncbi:MAG: TRAP transporter small permease subunit [Rhodobacter sp.]|nr:TRAP transporter small permease subunit [Rhodobacter sp.]